MSIFHRAERALFRISGEDAERLLNDVLTAHIPEAEDKANWWALLSPQGKLQAEGLIGRSGDGFWLDAHAEGSAEFFKRMRLYKMRAKAEIEDLSASHAVGWSAESPETGSIVHEDSRGAGFRVIAPVNEAENWDTDNGVYDAVRIDLGIAELGPDYASDSQFPHDVGMDQLGGIDFKKGCFIGQEVVSRMQHRGTARRRPVIVSGIPDVESPAVSCGGREAGPVGKVVGGSAVGLLRIDRIGDPGDATVAGEPVTLTLPAWATYRFGESPASE